MPTLTQREYRVNKLHLTSDVKSTPPVFVGAWSMLTVVVPNAFRSTAISFHTAADEHGDYFPLATLTVSPGAAFPCPPETAGAIWLKITTDSDDAEREVALLMKS